MKRIFNLLRYVIVVALNVFVMIVLHSYVNFILLVGMLLFPIYSIWGFYRIKNHIGIEIGLPVEPMQKGDEFKVAIRLINPTRQSLVNATVAFTVSNPFYQQERQHFLNIPVRAGKETRVEYPIEMEYCGRFVIAAKEIRLLDLLGIVETTIPVTCQKECLIFPKGGYYAQEAGRLYQKGVEEAMESREKGYDFSEISGIREYIPGDKLQNIHWKLSVKKDELMVKERVSVSAMQLVVLVEMVNDEEMRLESVLELADGITRALVEQNLPFTVFYYSSNTDQLMETYIGSEEERKEWLKLLLYDQSCQEACVEDMFLKEFPTQNTYLYIGVGDEHAGEEALHGNQNTIAVLRG